MFEIKSDCELWVVLAVGGFLLFVLSEILPFLRPLGDGEEDPRVHGVVQFLTFIIRSRWGRHHPQVQECLRTARDIVAERVVHSPVPNPAESKSSEVHLEFEAQNKSDSDVSSEPEPVSKRTRTRSTLQSSSSSFSQIKTSEGDETEEAIEE